MCQLDAIYKTNEARRCIIFTRALTIRQSLLVNSYWGSFFGLAQPRIRTPGREGLPGLTGERAQHFCISVAERIDSNSVLIVFKGLRGGKVSPPYPLGAPIRGEGGDATRVASAPKFLARAKGTADAVAPQRLASRTYPHRRLSDRFERRWISQRNVFGPKNTGNATKISLAKQFRFRFPRRNPLNSLRREIGDFVVLRDFNRLPAFRFVLFSPGPFRAPPRRPMGLSRAGAKSSRRRSRRPGGQTRVRALGAAGIRRGISTRTY